MDTAIARQIIEIQDIARNDPQYSQLLQEHAVLSPRFLDTLAALEEKQRAAIMDYMGLFASMHLRMLEIAIIEKDTALDKE